MKTHKVNVPEGKSGDWRIEKFKVSKREAERFNMRCAFAHGMRGRDISPGTYTRLKQNEAIVMSDTPAEIADHAWFVWEANGHILVAGLGLGMVTGMLAHREEVLSITVIELSEDVITLVGEHCRKDNKVKIIQGDIFKWRPHERLAELGITKFDCAWFDIWNELCADLLPEAKTLNRRFGRWAKVKHNWLENMP